MKTAEELFLFGRYCDIKDLQPPHQNGLSKEKFDLALADYKQSIIGLIDDMIELYQDHYRARQSLLELKQKIEEL